jgi:hypothetical protein
MTAGIIVALLENAADGARRGRREAVMHLQNVSSFVLLSVLLTVGASGLGSAGCGHPGGRGYTTPVQGSSAYVVPRRPPVPFATVYPEGEPPFEGAQWVQAHWEWSGSDYVWMNGYWIRPSGQYTYVQPRWQERDGGYVYIQGGWRDHAGARVVPASVSGH